MFYEVFVIGIGQIVVFIVGFFGDEDVGVVNVGWVELYEFYVLQGQVSVKDYGIVIICIGVC